MRKMASRSPLGARLLGESPPLEFTRAGELKFSRAGFAWPIEHWTAFSVERNKRIHATCSDSPYDEIIRSIKRNNFIDIFVNMQNKTSRCIKIVGEYYKTFLLLNNSRYAHENKRLRAE